MEAILPNTPVAMQGRDNPNMPDMSKSRLAPDDIQMDLISGKFDPVAYNMAKTEAARAAQAQQNPQANVQQPQQQQNRPNETVQNDGHRDLSREITLEIEKIRRENALLQKQNHSMPSQTQQNNVPVDNQQNVTPPVQNQNEQSKNENLNDDYYAKLFGQNSGKDEGNTQQTAVPQNQGTEQSQDPRMDEFMQKNIDYYNSISVEAARRNIDPGVVMDLLSKKSIPEMVDFAIGKINQSNGNEPVMPVQQHNQNVQPVRPPSIDDAPSPQKLQFDNTGIGIARNPGDYNF